MAPATYVNRAAIKASFALIVLLILGLGYLCRLAYRAWKSRNAEPTSLSIA